MTEENQTQETNDSVENAGVDTTTSTAPESDAEAKPVSKPRPPKLELVFEGKAQPLLKYPFPVKAAKFPVILNGEPAEAALTEGRGKAYTYILFNNTSFYVPGKLPVDAALTVNFPGGYPFDETPEQRKSNYKPKAKAEGNETATDGASTASTETVAKAATEVVAEPAVGTKAKRRGK